MVSFRFHLVSLVAVFLALALGIGMGATVIDKATVDSLKNRVAATEQQRDANQQTINDLNRRLSRSSAWETQAEQLLVSNALKNTPVVLFAVRGIDESVLSDQRSQLEAAGAVVQGVMYFTQKGTLSEADAVTQMQSLLGVTAMDGSQLRGVFLTRIAAVVAGTTPPTALKELQRGGFLEWEGRSASDISSADFAGSRVVFMAGATTQVPNEQIATPMIKLLAAQPTRRVVAIEAGRDPDTRTNTSGVRAVWLDVLRKDSSLDGRISTVDDVETDLGRTTTVLALVDLASGRTGDFGVADSADGPLPKLAS